MKKNKEKVIEHSIREFMITMLSNGMPSALSLIFDEKISARQFYKSIRKLELKALENFGLTENEASDTDDVLIWEENFVHFNYLLEDLHIMRLIEFSSKKDENGTIICKWKFNYRDLITINLSVSTIEYYKNDCLYFKAEGKVTMKIIVDMNKNINDLLNGTGISPSN